MEEAVSAFGERAAAFDREAAAPNCFMPKPRPMPPAWAKGDEVRLSPDMRHARVYVGIMSEPRERAAVLKGLAAAAGYVRHELVERLQLRRAPEIVFVPDESDEYGQRIEDLLRKSKDA